MADEHSVQLASAILDELTDRMNREIKLGKGFDNDSVMWLVKAWTDFIAQLMKWMSMSPDEVMKTVVTNMDRSA